MCIIIKELTEGYIMKEVEVKEEKTVGEGVGFERISSFHIL